jgi:hypothetical protein
MHLFSCSLRVPRHAMLRHRRRSLHSRALFAEVRSTHSKQSTTEIDAVPAWVRNASGADLQGEP